jgi:hypothetical protein
MGKIPRRERPAQSLWNAPFHLIAGQSTKPAA